MKPLNKTKVKIHKFWQLDVLWKLKKNLLRGKNKVQLAD